MMIATTDLPFINAILNSSAFLTILTGLIFIKKGNKSAHAKCMILGFILSTLFLILYLFYHYQVGSKHFTGVGSIRVVYFSILISHTILAVVNLPLILRTFYLASKKNWESHKKWARVTFPIWSYVSVTGVIVYLFLYQWYP